MTVRDGFFVAPEVEYACLYLEHHGLTFGTDFNLGDATTKAARMLTEILDHDEHGDWT
jgi:hypothetical protein